MDATASPAHRRRDRHGRGMRGQLAPAGVPLSRTRAERFDELVHDAVDHLEPQWAEQLAGVDFAVEEVPDLRVRSDDDLLDGEVPLARLLRGGRDARPVLVVYRRPLELRAADRDDLADAVHDVVVEQVAHLFGMTPEDVDPGYGDGEPD